MKKRYVKEHAVESWPYSHKPRTPKGSYGILCKKVKLQQNWQTLQTMPNQEKSNG